jgi:hypothetical protein
LPAPSFSSKTHPSLFQRKLRCGDQATPRLRKSGKSNNLSAEGLVSALLSAIAIAMWNGISIDSEQLLRDDVSIEILRYVITHPSAKDTINGIEKWWLSKNLDGEGKRKVLESLNLLVVKGWLIARCSPQSETIYSLNENSLLEINAFLKTNP